MPERKLIATLGALHDGGVEFILVGGLAAVLQGAPIDTFERAGFLLVYGRVMVAKE